MSRSYFLLIAFLACATAFSGAQSRSHAHKAKPKAPIAQPQPAQVPPQAQVPAPRPTPESGPASPPEVTMRGGQLTITARNSTLSDVLNAVKQKTGAAVDMPPASNERVVGKFGPGTPRDVMAQLLNGSHYDYVLLGSPSDPGALKEVVLTARAVGPEPPPQQEAPQQAYQPQMYQQNLPAVPQVETEQPPEENNTDMVPEQPPDQEPPEQPEQQEQPEQPQPGQNGPMVKTPEQLLRELQQQQQQQQQMQNGQPGPPER